ncbi:MAG: sigma-70 family RNA polymerase sigma factor [Terriglobia bacterium]
MEQEERDEMILRWLPLARRIATREFNRLGNVAKLLAIDADDLFQSGAVGLIRAAGNYKPELSAPQTYFTRRIRGTIYDFLRTFPYVSRRYGALCEFQSVNLFDEDGAEDRDGDPIESIPVIDAEFERVEERLVIDALVGRLSAQHGTVICGTLREMSQKLIARNLGVTEGRVSQIRTEAIAEMRRRAYVA